MVLRHFAAMTPRQTGFYVNLVIDAQFKFASNRKPPALHLRLQTLDSRLDFNPARQIILQDWRYGPAESQMQRAPHVDFVAFLKRAKLRCINVTQFNDIIRTCFMLAIGRWNSFFCH